MLASIPLAIVQDIEAHTRSTVTGFSFASGGCINQGGRLTTSHGVYFLKWNSLKKFPGMFAAEARGLSLLRNSKALNVPEVIHVGDAGVFQFLLLEYIEQAERTRDYWEKFGSGLASLHRNSSDEYGLDHDNYMGSLTQSNEKSSSWIEFFIEQRLKKQLKLAHDQNNIDNALLKKFDLLFKKLSSLLPEEPPALLHGDLWGGNLMTNARGEPCLIDPAVYYGHREVDLAMTQLFGGFNKSFLEGYNHTFPLAPGYEERYNIYNLYPLLIHVNLFGADYRSQVVSIVNQLV